MANALSVAFFCVLLQQARSQSCGAGSTDCRCIWTDPTTNQPVIFDLSGAFTYPLILDAALATSDYQYFFNPCAVFSCGVATTTPSNVCQENSARTAQYNAGASPKWVVTNSNTATITYTATTGTTIRSTTVTVVLSQNATNNSVSQVTEGTAAKYSFTVTLAGHSCTPDPTFGGCICRGAGFVQDISKTFKYPYTIKGQDGGYEYTYSPCTPITCGTSLSYVCQRSPDGMEYNVGVVPTWTIHNISSLNFTINYTVPESPRTTVVNFYQNPAAQFNTSTKVIEYPTNTYTFNVTLAPKPTCTPDAVYGGCICKGPSITLDISQTFSYPLVINGFDKEYDYVFSPCAPVSCDSSPAVVCQKDALTGMEYNCGVTAAWEVISILPLNFTVIYTVPGSPRTAIVNFHVKEGQLNHTTVVAEYVTNTYNFNVTIAGAPGTSYWTKAIKKLSNMFFFKSG